MSLRLLLLVVLFGPTAVLGQQPTSKSKPLVVMLIAEREYQTDESLPEFAKNYLTNYRTKFVFAHPDDGNNLVGIEAVSRGDVLLVSVRRRTLKKEQLEVVRQYVAAGKPVIGIRTASHAFSLRKGKPPEGGAEWPEFDRQVFGGNYTNHYGNSLAATISLAQESVSSPLLRGMTTTEPFTAGGSLYRVSPLAKGADVLLWGRVEGEPDEPVAWTFRREDGGKSFYTSLGHIDDFDGEVLPRLLVNAVMWSLEP